MSRVSVSTQGVQANADSYPGFFSADGRFVAYYSIASTLVPGDTNLQPDAFVFDRLLSTTERVSIGVGGIQGNETSASGGISSDGRYVLYGTGATTLVVPDLNGFSGDLILRDRWTGAQQFVSVNSAGEQGNDTSTFGYGLTPDARFVVFGSIATNLVPNDNNGTVDIFVRDRAHAITTRENISSTGVEANSYSGGPTISGDGRFVAFWSEATNLVPGDNNGFLDTFVRDRHANTTRCVSVASAGTPPVGGGVGQISDGGRYVTFDSGSPNLVPGDNNQASDVFRHDLVIGTTILISSSPQGFVGNANSAAPSISADGRFIAFHSQATNLVVPSSGSLDVYVRDVQTGVTRRASVNAQGQQGNDQDRDPHISADGRLVCFQSFSNNLIPGDTNFVADAYVQESPFTNPGAYCPPGASLAGCSPSLTTSGLPSATSSVPFHLRLDGIPARSTTLAFYGLTSPAQIPFNHSWLCVAPPHVRLAPLRTKGNSQQPCSGAILMDFNAWIQSGLDPALSVGTQVWLQFWIADPPSSRGLLSSALALVIEP